MILAPPSHFARRKILVKKSAGKKALYTAHAAAEYKVLNGSAESAFYSIYRHGYLL
jgi:hypothetical protein